MRRLLVCSLLSVVACNKAPEPAPRGKEYAEGPPQKAEINPKRAEAISKRKEVEAKIAAAKAKKEARRDYFWQLNRLDERIGKALEVAEKNPKASVGYDRAAQLYLSRARLSGDYGDYAKAQELLEKAFAANGDETFGPFMTRAHLHYTLHRLDQAQADFERQEKIPLKRSKAAEAAAQLFAANLELQRGNYEEALAGIEESLQTYETFNGLAAKAAYLWKAGDFEQAETYYQKALAEAPEQEATEPKAWIHLQLGLMDLERGKLDEAKEHYEAGLQLIDGYWLLREHIAEILTLQGKIEEAKKLYLDIIEQTNNPEFMDAMAGILLEEGKQDEAQGYIERAEQRYAEQMEMFPEAAYGHALDHFLEFGDDPKKTLELAKKNHELRPNAEAKQRLAQAYVKMAEAGGGKAELKKAKKVIEEALGSPYDTADLHWTAAEVYAALGDETRAEEERGKAKAINPTVG